MDDAGAFWTSGGAVYAATNSEVSGRAPKCGTAKTLAVLVVSGALVLAPLAVPTAASAVSIGLGNNVTGIADEGYNHTLIFRWQGYGSSGWTKEEAAGAGTTYSAPAIAETPTGTVIAYEGHNHTLIFRWQAYGTSTWNREEVAGAGTTYSAPAIAEVNNANVIAAEGPDHSLDFYWQPYGATQWGAEVVALQPSSPSGTTYSAPSVDMANGWGANVFNIFVEGPHHSLVQWQNSSSTGGWLPFPWGNNTTYSAPSAIDFDNADAVAYESSSNSLEYLWDGGSTPTPETVAGPATTFSAPSLAQGNNAMSIAVEGPSNSLDFYSQAAGSTVWELEPVNGAGSTYAAPSIAEGNNATTIAAEGPDHSLDFYWQEYGSKVWNPETAAGKWTTYA
jgi:hypothetical protein